MSSGDTEDVELNELNVPWRDTGPRRTNQRHLHELNTCLHSFHVRLSTFPFCFYSAPVVILFCFYSAFFCFCYDYIMLLFCFYYCFYYASVLLLFCFYSAFILLSSASVMIILC